MQDMNHTKDKNTRGSD